ncbi:DUF1674 domain-containing protein [Sphingosinicella sp. BN140058]|nr:DUF1674 domain-containing protein [Sphingosinicella sp. BN140058]
MLFILPAILSHPKCGVIQPVVQLEASVTGKRPPHVKPPAYLSKSPPIPEPVPARDMEENGGPKGAEPTRYGDWENNGRAWDF